MTFSYDPSLGDPVSQVRSIIQDNIEGIEDFQDEEIEYFLAVNNDNPWVAAREAAFRLMVYFTKQTTIAEVDRVKVQFGDKAAAFKTLLKELDDIIKKQKISKRMPMYFGGIDKADYNKNRSDGSTMKPEFTKEIIYFNERFPELSKIE